MSVSRVDSLGFPQQVLFLDDPPPKAPGSSTVGVLARGCNLSIPLGRGAVTFPKAVTPVLRVLNNSLDYHNSVLWSAR